MKRRRKWRAPNNPTPQAKMVWQAVYGEPWPKGWKVQWVGFMRGAYGLCSYGRKTILLSYGDAARKNGATQPEIFQRRYLDGLAKAFWYCLMGDQYRYQAWAHYAANNRIELERERPRDLMGTLIHEFTHVRNVGLKHGVEFDRLVRWGWDRLHRHHCA